MKMKLRQHLQEYYEHYSATNAPLHDIIHVELS